MKILVQSDPGHQFAAMTFDPLTLVRPRRNIVGMSAILLPFTSSGEIDWPGFRSHLLRTQMAGLIPAVNMDTGYVDLLDESTRRRVLDETQAVLADTPFVAGAFVGDQAGATFNLESYLRAIEAIQQRGGLPIIFQSFGLTGLSPNGIIEAYQALANHCSKFLAFELGQMFAPFGRIYDLETYAQLLAIPQCVGAKHSSLNRMLEWRRLQLRDEQRPDFMVLTGNDLAIDMVMYGSDYLLGLSTFAPDMFSKRDELWKTGDPTFHELNDLLQYLGFFAFRPPVPAYKHNAAQFLQLRNLIEYDNPHPAAMMRPSSDRLILADIARRLTAWTEAAR